MNELQIFQHPQFGKIELIVIDGKEWIGATQAANALGYANSHDAITKHCRPEGVAFREVLTSGGSQQMKFITEGNLYRLITRSRLPDAVKFERYVFDELLPTIRKHGAYMTPQTLEAALNNPDTMIQVLTRLKEEQTDKERERQARLTAEAKIEADRPLVLFAESLQVSDDSILIGELAKVLKQNGIDIGQNRLFETLRKEGYLIKSGEQRNMPTQRSMDLKIMEIKTGSRSGSDGTIKITRTPKVTGKGQVYFINKFKSMEHAG